jgi:ribosomal protein S11
MVVQDADDFAAAKQADASSAFAALVAAADPDGKAVPLAGIADAAMMVGFVDAGAETRGQVIVQGRAKVLVFTFKNVSPEKAGAFARAASVGA